MILHETNAELLLAGIVHRLTGVRHIDGDGDPEDDLVVLTITVNGAMLDTTDRLALARWLLVGMEYEVEAVEVAPIITARELEVIQAVRSTATRREAAQLLHVSENTVKTHLARVYRRLGVNNRTRMFRELRARKIIL